MRATVGTVLAVGLLTAGCGTFSDTITESGVDGLEVPTPSPDPADYVAVVDNPWFVLEAASYVDGSGLPVEQTVAAGPDVAGVPTTAVTLDGLTDLYAQDAAGNVWWFGREGEWEAGVDGAEAGLAMPADPRLGDGFRQAEVPGSELRATVVGLDDAEVVLDVVADAEDHLVTYTRGEGLTRVTSPGGVVVLELAP